MFNKYSFLESFHLVRKYDVVFVPEIIRIAPEDSWKIKVFSQIKEENYASYCEDYFKNKESIKCIKIKDSEMISFNDVQGDLRDKFVFLYSKNELSKTIAKENSENMVVFEKIDRFGNANINYNRHLEEFLGKDLLIKYNYVTLDEKINLKIQNKKQNKI